ncbi:hypothetical protein F0562_006247 [Nyssa sinensis]|uniref:Uncharacterized protein n=1 Tax=Nyssa sinensis TaxID=561372 RepID=A0A5J5AMU8_9ASTE|nr:hypothetical protein F0562_006247 [Nyssa sinensis]
MIRNPLTIYSHRTHKLDLVDSKKKQEDQTNYWSFVGNLDFQSGRKDDRFSRIREDETFFGGLDQHYVMKSLVELEDADMRLSQESQKEPSRGIGFPYKTR